MGKRSRIIFLLLFVFIVGCSSKPTMEKKDIISEDESIINEEVLEEFNDTESVNQSTPKVSAGTNHAIALKNDGSVWAWGSNGAGQLGSGLQTIYNLEFEVSVNNDSYKPQKIFENAIDIEAGDCFTLILTKDKKLYGCGSNTSGQIGQEKFINYLVPTFIADDVIAIDTSGNVSAYITSDNRLFIMGYIGGYHYFDSYNEEGVDYSNKPVYVMSNVEDVSLADSLIMILTLDRELYVYGAESDYREKRRNEDLHEYLDYKYTETPVKLCDDVKSIDSGRQVHMFTDLDNTLYSWGANGFDGQLGIDSDEFWVRERTLVLEDIIEFEQQMAIDTKGTLFVWGELNNWISFYAGPASGSSSQGGSVLESIIEYGGRPKEILKEIKACSHGAGTFFAIDKENNLYSWGVNNYGQIGDGTKSVIELESGEDDEGHNATIIVDNNKQEPVWIMNLDAKNDSKDDYKEESQDGNNTNIYVEIIADILNVRHIGSSKGSKIGEVYAKSQYMVRDTYVNDDNEIWYEILYNESQTGWIASWYCKDVD